MQKSLKEIKGFLVDLDGTTYTGGRALPGAVEFFAHLRSHSIPYLFFSNNPTKHISEYVAHITKVGVPATAENIITSTQATIHYLKDHKLTRVSTIGTPGFEQELHDSGISIDHKNPQALVISFDLTLTYEKLKAAALLLNANPELPYIATNPDAVCPTEEGPIPDCGALIAFLKTATNREPIVIGKPAVGMVHLACQRLGLEPADLAIVGDRLYTDMKMGHDHGLVTILLLSGETTNGQLSASAAKPDFVFEHLGDLLHHL